MRDHYLLDLHGIHPSFARRIVKEGRDTWVIEIKEPRIGTCPECGWRSHHPKERGVKDIQGLGGVGINVRIRVPWVRFYCSNEKCRMSSFRFRVLEGFACPGGVSPSVLDVVEQLALEEDQNNLEVGRLLWMLFGVSVSEPTLRRLVSFRQVRTPQKYAPVHLGIDEYFPKGQSRRKGRKGRVRLMLLDLDLGVVIASVRGQDRGAARRLLDKAKRRCDLSRVKSVTRDLCDIWDGVLHDELDTEDGPVSIRVDRFHLVRNLINELYTKVYASERMLLRDCGRFREARLLFVNRYRFRKRRSRLEAYDDKFGTNKAGKLDVMLSRYPLIADLYDLKERIFKLMDLGPGDGRRFQRHFQQVVGGALSLGLQGLADRLRRHRKAIRENILNDPPATLPEQCFVKIRAAERRRKSFRTERSRSRYYRAKLRSAILARRQVG
jgi:hypothetical protein